MPELRAPALTFCLCFVIGGCTAEFPLGEIADAAGADAEQITGEQDARPAGDMRPPEDGGQGGGGGADPDAEPPDTGAPDVSAPDAELDEGVPDEGPPDAQLVDLGPCPEPAPELCNGEDDDCDGRLDEGLGLGEVCDVGVGGCARRGQLTCDINGQVICDVRPGEPTPETCDGLDDDCDGLIDESWPLGDVCSEGEGLCLREGVLVCAGPEAVGCDVEAGEPEPELCDGLDNDCDGTADEEIGLGEACVVGLGICEQVGINICSPEAEVICSATPAPPREELCNALDDDCDGAADEGLGLGNACGAGQGICLRPGQNVCGPEGQVICDGVPGEPAEAEVCNNLDDDCDGATDEGMICGPWIAAQCRVWLAQGDRNNGPSDGGASFGGCMGSSRDTRGDTRCNSTRGDERFRELDLVGDLNDDDRLAVAWTCSDNANPALAAWMQSHCAVFLGHADFDLGANDQATWGPCPMQNGGEVGGLRCVGSSFDGLFHDMRLTGDVDGNDDLAVSFVCRDEADPARAAGAQQAVEVFLAWNRDAVDNREGDATWGDCPGSVRDNGGPERCVSSQGTGRFYKIDLTGDIDTFDDFGVMLRSRLR